MRTLLGLGMVLVLACGVTAGQERIDPKKLVGVWERPANKEKKQRRLVTEFTADGKAKFSVDEGEITFESQYAVSGNQLLLTARTKDGEIKRTVAIAKLTAEVLVTVEGTERIEYARMKNEKKEAP